MKTVENGHFVKIDYTGTLENGDTFDSSRNSQPIEVEVGAGRVIKGFEQALIGMALKEKKTFTLPPEEAYGPRDQNLEHSFTRSELPEGVDPKAGQVLTLKNPEGGQFPALVKHADTEKITVDLNHPLAGETLTFEIEVLEINDVPTPCSCTPSECGSCCSSCS
ncbi:MAG: peptidylprolyl isomerase [Thermodesulfobacteriota bacterium]|nr:peptidylprolyl isomerase [Thermodesulfobacteriota bacterium]